MKKMLYTSSFMLGLLLISQMSKAQSDTLFYLDFQTDPTEEMALFPDDDTDTLWINFDEDGIEGNNGSANWYWDTDWGQEELVDPIPETDTNFIFISQSWLTGFDTSSSNWLISPAMEIVDDQATLHWKSAPFQGPRYIDGYSVKILIGNQFHGEADQVDVVFQAAEMIDWIGDETSTDPDTFVFTNGYVHADYFMDSVYFVPPDVDSTGTVLDDTNLGLLEPHSISLAQYSGQTIFVAFHHDSADDNLLMIDDFLLMGSFPVSTKEPSVVDVRFVTYPNPVDNYLNVLYQLEEPATTTLNLYNSAGKLVQSIPVQNGTSGEINHQLDLRQLPSGNYNIVLTIDEHQLTKQVIKR